MSRHKARTRSTLLSSSCRGASQPAPAELASRRATQARAAPTALEQLLYSREQASKLLGGISVATLIRYEGMGLLEPVRLNKTTPVSKFYYRRSDLLRLVGERGGDDAEA